MQGENMFKQVHEWIKQYKTIIIHRHYRPDGDAIGSQIGLKEAIKATYPDKNVLITGDTVDRLSFLGQMDEVRDTAYQNALAIVLDCGDTSLISDSRYQLADKTIKIDHHVNKENYGDINIIDTDEISCASMITRLIMEQEYKLTPKGARALFVGLVADSGRFRYPGVGPNTFKAAHYLTSFPFDIEEVYQQIYTEPLNEVKLRAKYTSAFQLTEHNVAYLIIDMEERNRNRLSFSFASRGLISVMSEIDGISIWATFVENDDRQFVLELRSNRYNINQIASKYGGGGHLLASGATLQNKEQIDQILKDLDQLIMEETK
jgi:phosphoesterase RecJ-like protein